MSTQEVAQEKISRQEVDVHVYSWCLFFSLVWMIIASTPTMIICSTVASMFNIVFLGQALEYLLVKRTGK